mmetsp:Transcript_65146/g.146958  ORF Transcript_65146/g.146958 Transcript_65146/m.146958 type:complete len:134 (+) Transcript_65146:142-543(+)
MSGTMKDRVQMGLDTVPWDPVTTYQNVETMKVDIEGMEEEVTIDPYWGVLALQPDGSFRAHTVEFNITGGTQSWGQLSKKSWQQMTSTEQKITIYRVAKMNKRLRERQGTGPSYADVMASVGVQAEDWPPKKW